ncbi:hypothetical protein PFISCL1PPCAC_25294, partial [Pristionchus fissidentatus]
FGKGIHAMIQLRGNHQQVSVWSMHLDDKVYGPYLPQDNPKITAQSIVNIETYHNDRVRNIRELITNSDFKKQV